MLTLAAGGFLVSVLAGFFVLVSLFLVLIILIQKPKGGGLIGAFGGAGGSAQSAFGSRTGDILTWVTCTLFALFLLLAIALTFGTRPPSTATATAATQPASGGSTDVETPAAKPEATPPATPAAEVPKPTTAPATRPEAKP